MADGLDCICRHGGSRTFFYMRVLVSIPLWSWGWVYFYTTLVNDWQNWWLGPAKYLKKTWVMILNLAFEWTCNFNTEEMTKESWGALSFLTFCIHIWLCLWAQCNSQTKFLKSIQSNSDYGHQRLLFISWPQEEG